LNLSSNEFARRRGTQTVFRDEPMRVRFELSGIGTSDRHDLRCAFDCSLRVAESSADRRLLAEVLLHDRESLTRDGVILHLSRKLVTAANDFASQHTAADLTGGGATRDQLLESIRQAADAAAFARGLIVMPPFAIDVESPSLQREKLEAIQRARAEERAAEQVEHLRRAGELLRQFQSIRESSSQIAPGQVLEQVTPADRGSTLEALLLAASRAEKQATLFAVAGPYLVRIDTSSEQPAILLTALPPTLGPLRSVQPATIDGKQVLLIGARDGVMSFQPGGSPDTARMFKAPASQSQLGFNRAIIDNDRVLRASHGDYGLVNWSIDSGELIEANGPPQTAVRNLQLLAPRTLLFSSKAGAFVKEGENEPAGQSSGSSDAEVIAIILDASRAFMVHADGTIATIDRSTRELIDTANRPGRICAAAALPWLGSIRLLIARDDGPIECVGPDDQLVTQYLSPHRGYKMLAASADLVAAVSGDRQRLILWHSWDGRKPIADLHVTAQARHRIADIDFA
jgi:hypothetical protein